MFAWHWSMTLSNDIDIALAITSLFMATQLILKPYDKAAILTHLNLLIYERNERGVVKFH